MHHLLKTLIETAYAMKHLHNMHILHRDLKIQNILLKSSNRDTRGFTVKVSDFGLAKVWDGRGGTSPTENQKYAGAPPPPILLTNESIGSIHRSHFVDLPSWVHHVTLTLAVVSALGLHRKSAAGHLHGLP